MSDTPRTDEAWGVWPYAGPGVHANFARGLERELAAMTAERDELLRSVESDLIAGSCNCGTKTPELRHHKLGCKFRLISERGQLIQERDELISESESKIISAAIECQSMMEERDNATKERDDLKAQLASIAQPLRDETLTRLLKSKRRELTE